MSKAMKAMMQRELQERFDGVDGGVFVSSQGLDSEKTYNFRKSMHAAGVKFTVVRNAFVRKVFESWGYDGAKLAEVLKGPRGVLYTTEDNSAATAAKALHQWKRANKDKIVKVEGAFVEGEVLDKKTAAGLKDAPTKDEARAQLLGVLQAPAVKLLAQIREPHARIVYLLNAWKEKREEGGEAAA
ncbi:MAG: 50S ribosomal protein L10 [Planctomycetota bacterium]|nr:MAG: 50S ribosomal protein L10 [Planctomycetota bacterium]